MVFVTRGKQVSKTRRTSLQLRCCHLQRTAFGMRRNSHVPTRSRSDQNVRAADFDNTAVRRALAPSLFLPSVWSQATADECNTSCKMMPLLAFLKESAATPRAVPISTKTCLTHVTHTRTKLSRRMCQVKHKGSISVTITEGEHHCTVTL